MESSDGLWRKGETDYVISKGQKHVKDVESRCFPFSSDVLRGLSAVPAITDVVLQHSYLSLLPPFRTLLRA